MENRPTVQKLENIEKMQGQTLYFVRLLAERINAGEIKLPEIWYDNQDVMTMLHISASTLKRHRRDGILLYKKIKRKCYYREADVLAMLLHAEPGSGKGLG